MKRYKKTNGWDFLIKLTDKLDKPWLVVVFMVLLLVAPITWRLPEYLPLLQTAAGKASDNLLLKNNEDDEHRHD